KGTCIAAGYHVVCKAPLTHNPNQIEFLHTTGIPNADRGMNTNSPGTGLHAIESRDLERCRFETRTAVFRTMVGPSVRRIEQIASKPRQPVRSVGRTILQAAAEYFRWWAESW